MKKNKILLIFRIIQFFRVILAPGVWLILGFLSPWLRKRLRFELKNGGDLGCQPFKNIGKKAHYCFEISSEGELEQARPLIDLYLNRGNLLELIFSSPSVEKKLQKLYLINSSQVRYLRLPLISYFPFLSTKDISRWISAEKVILTRYDFYPELILLAKKSKLYLLAASFKNKKKSAFNLALYSLFQRIVCSTRKDKELFMDLGIEEQRLACYELRLERISKRISNSQDELKKYAFYEGFSHYLGNFSKDKRVMFGNIWPVDLEIIKNNNLSSSLLAIAPHLLLSREECDSLFSKNSLIIDDLNKEYDFSKRYDYLVFNVRGVLVELYSFFGISYVGGGFGRSVHSLLEPFVAGCHVLCGPKVHRSTEYDICRETEAKRITILPNLEAKIPRNLEHISALSFSDLANDVANFLE